jgi:hypothetical protein
VTRWIDEEVRKDIQKEAERVGTDTKSVLVA